MSELPSEVNLAEEGGMKNEPATAGGSSIAMPQKRQKCQGCGEMIIPCRDTCPGMKTHIIAAVLFALGFPFCVFLPYCFDCFGKPVLRCSKCGLMF